MVYGVPTKRFTHGFEELMIPPVHVLALLGHQHMSFVHDRLDIHEANQRPGRKIAAKLLRINAPWRGYHRNKILILEAFRVTLAIQIFSDGFVFLRMVWRLGITPRIFRSKA